MLFSSSPVDLPGDILPAAAGPVQTLAGGSKLLRWSAGQGEEGLLYCSFNILAAAGVYAGL
jgi:hypothetical protein